MVAWGERSEAKAERRGLHHEQCLMIARIPCVTPCTDGFSHFFFGYCHACCSLPETKDCRGPKGPSYGSPPSTKSLYYRTKYHKRYKTSASPLRQVWRLPSAPSQG